MKGATLLGAGSCLACVSAQKYGQPQTPPVTSEALQSHISTDDLLKGAQQLQDFADANGGNRVFGSPAHNATVNWLADTLKATGYYDVELQPFVALFSGGSSELTVAGEAVESALLTYTPNGEVAGPIVAAANLGCDAADFPPETTGAISIIARGTCPFAQKVTNAAAAGAVGAVVFNNVPGNLAGTLGGPGEYVPSVGITQEAGEAIMAQVQAGAVEGTLLTNVIEENRTTYNVLAETKGGDHNNVIMAGGHSDSVEAGPGINDDGSGIVGILNVALALTKYSVKNAVRFGFWSAEEFGLLGSEHYMSVVNQTADIEKIRLYLNFDMIASPNYIYGIYDGDGNAFNISGPPGSAEIEATFEEFFAGAGLNSVPTAFTGRSDYGPFLDNNIPAGGLFTGAEVVKTEEEVALFGGEAGVAYDANYHEAGDTIDNLNLEAFTVNTKAIAHSVAVYATSLDTIPPVSRPNKFRRAYMETLKKFRRRAAETLRHGRDACGKHEHSEI